MRARGQEDRTAEVHDGVALVAGKELDVPWLRFRAVIGRGANGVVFEARDTELDRVVAVKVWFKKGADARARGEARKLATVPNRRVIAVHHFGTTNGMPFVVMEHFASVTLNAWLQTPRPFIDRCEVWKQVAEGLDMLYRAGHQHGDPHWENILVREGTTELSLQERLADRVSVPLIVKLTDLGATTLWANPSRLARREAEVVWETGARLFSTEKIEAQLNVKGLDAANTLAAINAFVEVERLLLDVSAGRDEYARTSARYSISINMCEAPFFELEPFIERLGARISADELDMLRAEILSGIRLAEHGQSSTMYSAAHDLSRVQSEYLAWRRRFLAAQSVTSPC